MGTNSGWWVLIRQYIKYINDINVLETLMIKKISYVHVKFIDMSKIV